MDLMKQVADQLYDREDYDAAKTMYKELAEGQLEEGDIRGCITSYIYSSNCYNACGLVDDAIVGLKKALDVTESYLATNNSLIGLYLEAKHNLANCLAKKKQYEEALVAFRQIAKMDEQIGATPSDMLATFSSIAFCCSELGKLVEAREMYEKILEKHLQIYGENNRHTSTIKNNLATTIMDIGDYGSALPLLEGIVQDLLRMGKSEQSMDVIECRRTLINCLHQHGDHQKALELCKEVDKHLKEKFQGSNPVIISNQRKMVDIMSSLNMHEEALKIAKENVKLHEELYEDADPAILSAIITLGNCHGYVDDFAKACEILMNAEEKFKDTAAIKTLSSLREHLGNWLFMLNRFDEAMKKLNLAESELEKVLGADHFRVVNIQETKKIVAKKMNCNKEES